MNIAFFLLGKKNMIYWLPVFKTFKDRCCAAFYAAYPSAPAACPQSLLLVTQNTHARCGRHLNIDMIQTCMTVLFPAQHTGFKRMLKIPETALYETLLALLLIRIITLYKRVIASFMDGAMIQSHGYETHLPLLKYIFPVDCGITICYNCSRTQRKLTRG